MYDLTDPNNPKPVGVSPTDPTKNFVFTDQTGRFQIQVKSGTFNADGTTDGVKTFGFQVVDATGTVGPMTKFTFVLDTTPIIQASSVQFAAGSDSGRSATDKITNVIRPTIIGQAVQAAPVTVQLIDVTDTNHPVVIGQGTTTASGAFSIQVNSGLQDDGTTDGVKTIQVVACMCPTTAIRCCSRSRSTDASASRGSGALPSSRPDSRTAITLPMRPRPRSGTGEPAALVSSLFANGGHASGNDSQYGALVTVVIRSPRARTT